MATVGDASQRRRFVVARAAIALQRLLPRNSAGQRWLGRRAWLRTWVAVALVLGLPGERVVNQLGPPERVNLLAQAVWEVVGWNLHVYLALLLPSALPSLRAGLSRWALRGPEPLALLWARQPRR